jgi:hypothetical protein
MRQREEIQELLWSDGLEAARAAACDTETRARLLDTERRSPRRFSIQLLD